MASDATKAEYSTQRPVHLIINDCHYVIHCHSFAGGRSVPPLLNFINRFRTLAIARTVSSSSACRKRAKKPSKRWHQRRFPTRSSPRRPQMAAPARRAAALRWPGAVRPAGDRWRAGGHRKAPIMQIGRHFRSCRRRHH